MADEPKKQKIQTGFAYWPLLADLVLRYVCFSFWRSGRMASWLFWFLQLFVISLVSVLIMSWRTKRLERHYGVASNQEYEVKDAPAWICFLLAVVVNNVAHSFNDVHIAQWWWRIPVEILLASSAFSLTLVVGVMSSTDERLDHPSEVYEAFQVADENDRILTRMQAELADFVRKVEAYTIESTLIGAISFAAFVTIVMGDKGRFETAHTMLGNTLAAGIALVSLKKPTAVWQLFHYPLEGTILVSVALSSLVCSLFFMGVIVARLRFSSLLGGATFSVEMATSLNRKEEDEVKNGGRDGEKVSSRMEWLSAHVDMYLTEGRLTLEQLRPIIIYMTVFRTLGLLAFMLTLVLSALWFGPHVAGCFAIVAVVTYCYPWIDSVRDRKLRKTDFTRLRRIFTRKLLG